MRYPILIASALLASALPLLAETAKEENCDDAKSTAEIVQCLATQTALWGRRLNTAYRKLMTSLPPRRRERLRNAQRVWVQFREANCGYFASGAGTIARVEGAQCMRRLTAARATELEGEI